MFKSFAIKLCRVFITQQKISTHLSVKKYLCDIFCFLNSLRNWESFRFCVCVCVRGVCMCVCGGGLCGCAHASVCVWVCVCEKIVIQLVKKGEKNYQKKTVKKHESKPPCLIVLDLEVICLGKKLFFSNKIILLLPCL